MENSPGPDQLDDGPDPDGGGATGAGTDPSDGEKVPDVEEPVDGSEETAADGRDPLRFNRWMKRSATGAVMTGIAVGLQQALELPKQQPAFVIEASGEPDDPDKPIDLRFDPDSPADTVAVIRRPAAVDPPAADPHAADPADPATS
ncbi:MAG TPA: hypothetical protein VHW93_03925 [Acidimicrobiales bacterium]|nr:hypothetical protein [Acidimicrobiales bacterium]